jgi:hypothetical protein
MKPTPTTQSSPSQPQRWPNTDFLDAARVIHGPAYVIGRVFLKAEQALRERGITLSCASFEELADVNRSNQQTWRPLVPIFDPNYADLNANNSYCLLGRDSRGDVVASQCGRLYEWHDTNFFEEARTMRLFYSDPGRQAPPAEGVLITAEKSKQISGQAVFSGAGWYRPDYRKKNLVTILSRVSRALAYTRWKTDVTVTLMAEGVFKGGYGDRAGYTNFDWALELKNFAIGSPRMAVLWMQRDQMLQDLSWFLDSFGANVGGRVHHGGAH